MPDYVRWLRQRVGREPVLLNFAAACVLQDGEVLLQRRGDDGNWGIPGGAMELDESAEEAALREVAEETGLQVRVDALLGVYTKYERDTSEREMRLAPQVRAWSRTISASWSTMPG